MDEWHVYIVRTESGTLYTGITKDLKKRFSAHKNKNTGARFFRISKPKNIVFTETHPNRSSATKRELSIKKMSRKQKLELVAGITS